MDGRLRQKRAGLAETSQWLAPQLGFHYIDVNGPPGERIDEGVIVEVESWCFVEPQQCLPMGRGQVAVRHILDQAFADEWSKAMVHPGEDMVFYMVAEI